MIRINLLPKEKRKRDEIKIIKKIIIIILILYMAVGVNFLIINNKEKRVSQTLIKLREEAERLSYVEKEIKKLKEKEKQIKERITILNSLLKDNLTLIREIDYITKTIPQERIFLDLINYQRKTIKIRGKSLDLKDIASYIKSLKNYKNFKEITLGNIKSTNNKIIKFEIIIERKNEKKF